MLAQPGYYYPNGVSPYGGSGYPYGTPRLSPYLNMLRGGNSPANAAANYYSGVVPEVERRANARQFGSAINSLERQVTGLEEEEDLFPRLSATGHPAVFGNYGGYFYNTGNQRLPPNTSTYRPQPPRTGGR